MFDGKRFKDMTSIGISRRCDGKVLASYFNSRGLLDGRLRLKMRLWVPRRSTANQLQRWKRHSKLLGCRTNITSYPHNCRAEKSSASALLAL